jgi:EAL domain-containing protein (putative c-di-GMP-specific phosphodiesterase class I)
MHRPNHPGGEISGFEARIDIHHRDSGRATVKHRQKGRDTTETGPIPNTRRAGDHRAGDQTAHDTRQRTIHPRDDNHDVGCLQTVPLREDSMQTRDSDIRDQFDIRPHDAGCDLGFMRDRQIAGTCGDHHEIADTGRLRAVRQPECPSQSMLHGVGKHIGELLRLFAIEPGHKGRLTCERQALYGRDDPLRRLAFAEYHFRKAASGFAIQIEFRETQVGYCRRGDFLRVGHHDILCRLLKESNFDKTRRKSMTSFHSADAFDVDPITMETISDGLYRKEFFVEYLPTISLKDRKCLGAESLVRWRRNTSLIAPLNFIPLIENSPLSGLLTYYVIDTVAEELKHWLDLNPTAHISINVPPQILGRGGIEYAAVKTGLNRHRRQFIMEVTERGIPDQLGLAGLERWSHLGVRIALDDVTLSGANLALLTRSPIDLIKIDRALTGMITRDDPCPSWLNGLQALLKATNLEVIAEGVEHEYQADVLWNAGITMAQGFFFSKPMSRDHFIAFFDKNS